MLYFVKSALPANKVEEFTRKLANHEIKGVDGNTAYVSPDGRIGYDIVECRDEQECRQKYSDLERNGLRIESFVPIEPLADYIKKSLRQREVGR